MRRITTVGAAAIITAGILTGCTAGPNQEAAEAAEGYAEELAAWSGELGTALEGARTATSDEWAAVPEGGSLPFEEVGLGDVLEDAPALEDFDADAVENTPTYLTAARIEAQVTAIVEELADMEPAALETLRFASYDSYWAVADLYYNTLGGPAADLRSDFVEATDYVADTERYYGALRASNLAFAEQRAELLGTAIEAMQTTAVGTERPVIPEEGLGASIGAFIVDWLEEEVAFQEDAQEAISSWSYLSTPYQSFWNHGNVNATFDAPLDYAASLRSAFIAQVDALSTALTAATASAPASDSAAHLPAIGDPYRQALLDGYLPWGDAAESQDRTTARLWMLWRIRELEETSDAAYTTARSAILEELNRAVEDDEGEDFRPGATRLLSLIEKYSTTFDPWPDTEANAWMVATLQEIVPYGELLRSYPMLPEVAEDFDAILALLAEANDAAEQALKSTDEENDQYLALADVSSEYADRILETATPSLELLDDDARTEELIAAAINATAPSAASEETAE